MTVLISYAVIQSWRIIPEYVHFEVQGYYGTKLETIIFRSYNASDGHMVHRVIRQTAIYTDMGATCTYVMPRAPKKHLQALLPV